MKALELSSIWPALIKKRANGNTGHWPQKDRKHPVPTVSPLVKESDNLTFSTTNQTCVEKISGATVNQKLPGQIAFKIVTYVRPI